MKKFNLLFLFLIHLKTSISTPVQELPSAYDPFRDVMFKNEEIDSLNEPLLELHNSNPDFTSICWAESLIVTENKRTKNKTISKAYSILLDSPGNIPNLPEGTANISSCYEVLEDPADKKKALNFTTTKETDDFIIQEHKTMFCGAGPVLSHHFIVWPKLKRKQIEISVNPLGYSHLKNCSEIENEELISTDGSDEDEVVGSPHKATDESAIIERPTILEGNDEIDDIEEDDEDDVPIKQTGAMHGSEEPSRRSLPDNHSSKEDNPGEEALLHDKKPIKEKRKSQSKLKNSLLVRNINCTVDKLGVCNEMIEKSKKLVGSSKSSKVALGKWFFPDSAFDGPLDKDRSFMLKVKMIVNLKKNNIYNLEDNEEYGDEGDDEETELVVEEDCLYVVPNEKTKSKRKRFAIN